MANKWTITLHRTEISEHMLDVAIADANDLKPAALDRPADRCDLDPRVRLDRVQQPIEVGNAIGLQSAT